jgi:hypothetical protein
VAGAVAAAAAAQELPTAAAAGAKAAAAAMATPPHQQESGKPGQPATWGDAEPPAHTAAGKGKRRAATQAPSGKGIQQGGKAGLDLQRVKR